MDTFPQKPASNYKLEDLISYLLELQGMGLSVYQMGESKKRFEIVLNEAYSIVCSFNDLNKVPMSQIQLNQFGVLRGLADITDKIQLEEAVSKFIKQVLGTFPASSRSARLKTDEPATNFQSIANLIGSSEITAVFDPYLDNSSLAGLINICSYGNGKIGDNIRLLGSSAKGRGPNPTFTQVGTSAFFAQKNIIGTAKVITESSEHRRFLLLSGGKTLLLGHSLNSIHKNEAIRVEPDIDDLVFFNEMWDRGEIL